jgi:hypothetical protein
MTNNQEMRELVERLQGEQRIQQEQYGRGLYVLEEAVTAIESLTRRVSDLEGDLMAKNSALDCYEVGDESV